MNVSYFNLLNDLLPHGLLTFPVYNSSDKNEGDTSVMTYRGHRVTKSLIRAKFSPLETTGQRFIYTGCGTGRVIGKVFMVAFNIYSNDCPLSL